MKAPRNLSISERLQAEKRNVCMQYRALFQDAIEISQLHLLPGEQQPALDGCSGNGAPDCFIGLGCQFRYKIEGRIQIFFLPSSDFNRCRIRGSGIMRDRRLTPFL